MELHPPAYSHPSATPGHYHLWYHCTDKYRSKNQVKINAYQLTCDVRSANEGYAVLYEPENLLQAVKQHQANKTWSPNPNGLYYKLKPYAPPKPRPKRARSTGGPQQQKMFSMLTTLHPRPLPASAPQALATAIIEATQKGARNTTLFDHVRWTYRKLHRNDATTPYLTHQDWTDDIVDTAIRWNSHFPDPLSQEETVKTAHSIANYLWNNPTHGRKGFLSQTDSATQRDRQKQQAESRRAKNRPRDRIIEALYNQGLPQRAIAARVGLTPGRISQLLAQIRRGSLICHSPPQGRPGRLTARNTKAQMGCDDNSNKFASRPTIRKNTPHLRLITIAQDYMTAESPSFDTIINREKAVEGRQFVDNSATIVDNSPISVDNPVDKLLAETRPTPNTDPVGPPAAEAPRSPVNVPQAQNQNSQHPDQDQHTPEQERSAKQKCNKLQPKTNSPP